MSENSQGSINNLVAIYELATSEQHDQGINWYQLAHDWCVATAKHFSLPLKTVVGITAALSPSNSWERNQRDVYLVIQEFNEGNRIAENIKATAWNTMVWKAIEILEGDDPEYLLTSPKIQCFYQNILNPKTVDNEIVTIDRWTYRAWLFDSKAPAISINKYLYKKIAEDVRRAAEMVGLEPREFQAVVWIVVKDAGRGRRCQLDYLQRQYRMF